MNLPNKLTMLRIILIPFMMFFYLASFIPFGIGKIVATVIFIVASLTDLLDGKIARKYNLVTDLGKFLDPIADKLLTATAFLLIMADGTLPAPWGVIIVAIIIAREYTVSALRQIAGTKGIVLAADMWGKIKTVVQMIALPTCFLVAYLNCAGFASATAILVVSIVSYVLVGLATVLTVMSGIHYLVKNRECFKDDNKNSSKGIGSFTL